MKKVLLIDADSTIPNIALMKLSTFHKSKGDSVTLLKANLPYYPNRIKKQFIAPKGFDNIYCSVIFEGNKDYIKGDNIVFGGTGYNLKTKLPAIIERVDCDYSIYPENKFSYGFITRGCIRNCAFCKVPEKEGYIHKNSTINKIVKHKVTKFLDNNILAYPDHLAVLQELIDKKIRCQFNQGLDIRLLTKKNSLLLQQLKYFGEYIFAFDDWKYKEIIEKKLKLLSWRKAWQIKFFVYVNPKMPLKTIVNRIEWLKKNKCLPYVMRDIACWEHQYSDFFVDIAAYCNQVNCFKKMSFETFLKKRHPKNNNRLANSLYLWRENNGT